MIWFKKLLHWPVKNMSIYSVTIHEYISVYNQQMYQLIYPYKNRIKLTFVIISAKQRITLNILLSAPSIPEFPM